MPKTNAEKQREYRERKKANQSPKPPKPPKPPPKSAKERVRLYRERKRLAMAALRERQQQTQNFVRSFASPNPRAETIKQWVSVGSKAEEPLRVTVTEKKIKDEPIEYVDIDDIILPESVKSHHNNETLFHSQEENISNVERAASVPQPLVFLLSSQFVNQKIQNVEKYPSLPQISADSVSQQSKSQMNDILNNVNNEGKKTDPAPSKTQKKSFEDALENLPLSLQSSVLERLDSLNRHIETNTCALSILTKAVSNISNISDSIAQAVSAVNNLSKSLNYIGNTLEQLIQRQKE